MKSETILQHLGLSDHETTIYLALVEHGPQKIAQLAKQTGLHRPTIYKTIPALEQKGLVTRSPKGKQIVFSAEPPTKLQSLFHDLQSSFESMIPELEQTFAGQSVKPILKVLEGKKGIMWIWDDLIHSLKRGEIFFRYSSKSGIEAGEKYLPKNYRVARDAKQLQRFVITSQELAKFKKPRLERAVKAIPEKFGKFDFGVTVVIYGNKVAYVDYNSETALLIENGAIAEFQKKLFKIMYELLPSEK